MRSLAAAGVALALAGCQPSTDVGYVVAVWICRP